MAVVITLGWFVLAFWVATRAEKRGRSAGGWFALSTVFSPLIGIALLMALPEVGNAALPRDAQGNPMTALTHQRCPACRELIHRDASVCRYCGKELEYA